MEPIKTLLEQQPLMALFLTIAIGYLVFVCLGHDRTRSVREGSPK